MQVILREDVKDLGRAGETVRVSEGYGRNYLLPRQLAVVATTANLKRTQQEMNGVKGRAKRALRDAQYMAEKIAAEPVVIQTTAGEGGKLFGSVTAADLEKALDERGVTIDKRKIELDEPIKLLGTYTVNVKVASEVTAALTVIVQTKPSKVETPKPEVTESAVETETAAGETPPSEN